MKTGFLASRARALAWLLLAVVLPVMRAGAQQVSPDALVRAYPAALAGFEAGELVWRDGTRMAVSDGSADKPPEAALRYGSILDQLRQPYPRGPLEAPPTMDSDPGRIRNRAFFDRMYGDCTRGEVEPNLVPVVWLPQGWGGVLRATRINGVAEHLAAVSREMDLLPAEEKRFLYPPGGTYACRPVADTGARSMHAYGAAIDINVARSDYWLWRVSRSGPAPYRNRIPADIVAIFEAHGFIWGGKWAHFDTMHFEYRPEMLGLAAE